MIYLKRNVVTVEILYYMPDYNDIVQEFIWQTDDIVPEIPRVHKFLNFWKHNIEAVIKEVQVGYSDKHNGYRTVEMMEEIKRWH
tara:strand:- start:921 stop:1172 length:252 start_codon:yes stop_codon:yes gene_type:complete